MGDLTKEEQAVLDQLQKVCDGHRDRTTATLRQCATLKYDQETRTMVAAEKAARQKADEVQAASIRLLGQRQQATNYVAEQINALQTAGVQINGALWKATTDYDAILQARAGSPILVDIILNLGIEMVPELKLLGRTMKAFELARRGSAMKGWTQMADLAIHVGAQIPTAPMPGKFTSAVKSFGDFLDRRSNDIIGAIRNPVVANSDIDEVTAARMTAYNAKNQILSNVLGDLHRKLAIASFMEHILHKFIFWWEGEDVLIKVQQAFKSAGLDSGDYASSLSSFDALSSILLHDMLHAYVKSYVVVSSMDELRSGGGAKVEGLDEAQLQMLFDKMREMNAKIPNHTGRMPVYDCKGLVDWLGARFEKTPAPLRVK